MNGGRHESFQCSQTHISNNMKFRIILEPDEDGVFVAECPTLPGCISEGATRDVAMANMRDAIQGYIHSLEKQGDPVPMDLFTC